MLKRGEVVKLVRVVVETRETEIGCDECFERLDSFAETELSGVEATAAMPLVGDHPDTEPLAASQGLQAYPSGDDVTPVLAILHTHAGLSLHVVEVLGCDEGYFAD